MSDPNIPQYGSNPLDPAGPPPGYGQPGFGNPQPGLDAAQPGPVSPQPGYDPFQQPLPPEQYWQSPQLSQTPQSGFPQALPPDYPQASQAGLPQALQPEFPQASQPQPQQSWQAQQEPPQFDQQYPYFDPAGAPLAGQGPTQAYPMPPYDAAGAFLPPAAPLLVPPAAGYPSPEYAYPPTTPYSYAPAPYYGYRQRTNTLALLSLILALVGIPGLAFVGFFDILVLGGAVVCGHIAQNQFRRTGMAEKGRGMALAGLIVAYSMIAIGIVFTIFLVAFGFMSSIYNLD